MTIYKNGSGSYKDGQNWLIEGFAGGIGTDSNDILTGSFLFGANGDDELIGNDGNDILIGGSGDDILEGGGGIDIMFGWSGDDTYVIDNVRDSVHEAAKNGNDTVRTSLQFTSLTGHLKNVENIWLDGTESINAAGSAGANGLTGNDGDNRLLARAGDDHVTGGGGNDLLLGGAGDDTLYGDTPVPQLSQTITGDDVIDGGAGNDLLSGGAGTDKLLGGTGDDKMVGGDGADLLFGGAGNDIISGDAGLEFDAGDDVLSGGAGNDTLTGGLGDDIFRFDTKLGARNIDSITDFKNGGGLDHIQLSHKIFSNAVGSGNSLLGQPLDTADFVQSTSLADASASRAGTTADAHFLFDSTTGGLYYDADGGGAKSAVQFATLTGVAELAASDFLII